MTEDYNLVLPFKDQSPSFVYGFECGQLYEQIRKGEKIEGEQIHEENREQMEIICRRFVYKYEIGISVAGWCSFDAEPSGGQN